MADKARIDVDVVVSNQKRIAQLERSLGRAKTATLGLGSAAKIAATAFAAIGFTRLVGNVVNTIRQFQDLRQTLITIEGDAQKAAESFDLIREFTAGTTFQLGEVTNAFITFKNAGLNPTADFMTNIGNIAAGMGKRIDEVSQAVFNATTGEFEMLKQLGIKVKTEGDRLTVNFRGIAYDIANDGQSIIDFLSEIGRVKFAGSIERQSQTLTGAISNMKDEFAILANEIGEGGLTDALTQVTRDIISLTKENKHLARELGENLGKAILFVRDNFELLTKVLAALALGSLIASFGRLATGITALTTAIKIMTVAARANPIIAGASLLAAGVVLVGDKFGWFGGKTDEVTEATHKNTKALFTSDEAYTQFTATVEQATQTVDTNSKALFTSNDAYRMATAEIATNSEEIKKNTGFKYDNAIATGSQNKAQEDLIKNMRQKYEEVLLYNESELEANLRKEQEERNQQEASLAIGAINYEEYEKALTSIALKYSNQRAQIQAQALEKEKQRRDNNLTAIKQGNFKNLDLTKATQEEMKEIAVTQGRQTLDILASQNKKFFELQKAVKIAEAIQNTYLGATKAFAQGGIFGFITGALIVAAGMAQVNAIRSQQYPGRKFGGQVMAGQSYRVGESGEETFTPSSTGMITPHSQSGGRTEVNVNFNINTVDASSFDNLLVERRDTIVGVINQALNENGQRSLV